MASRVKRALFLVHRWMGIVLCLFFGSWFVSGVVMMYVGYPKLTPAERLARLPSLNAAEIRISPLQAVRVAGLSVPPREIRLAAVGGRAAYVITPDGAAAPAGRGRPRPLAVTADEGRLLGNVDAALARASAAAYFPGMGSNHVALLREDTWTHSRALDPHRPLHLVEMADPDRTWLYVSSSTGEVVRDASGTERMWGYVGAWLHFLYFFRDTAVDAYWSDIIIWLSLAGAALVLVGSVVGVQRWRFAKRYGNGSRSPYRNRMMRWHHISGLVFALVAFTWVFSGLMSMNPWRIFESRAPQPRLQAYTGGALNAAEFRVNPAAIVAAQAAGAAAKELRFVRVAGESYVQAVDGEGRITLFDAQASEPKRAAIDRSELKRAVARLSPAGIRQITEIRGYDAYYYARAPHTMLGSAERPLPVWRIEFDDAPSTWMHVDPATGTMLGRLDELQRVKRWLFAFLHSWDWLPLLERRPLWDVLLIMLSVGGAALSFTGVVIGWRRLQRVRRVDSHG